MERTVLLGIVLFITCFSVWTNTQGQDPRHKIVVQYQNPQPVFLRVWLDSTAVITDTLRAAKTKPPIVKMLGIGDLYQYKKLTIVVGEKAYAAKIDKSITDIVINPGDSVKPIILYKNSIKLK